MANWFIQPYRDISLIRSQKYVVDMIGMFDWANLYMYHRDKRIICKLVNYVITRTGKRQLKHILISCLTTQQDA